MSPDKATMFGQGNQSTAVGKIRSTASCVSKEPSIGRIVRQKDSEDRAEQSQEDVVCQNSGSILQQIKQFVHSKHTSNVRQLFDNNSFSRNKSVNQSFNDAPETEKLGSYRAGESSVSEKKPVAISKKVQKKLNKENV